MATCPVYVPALRAPTSAEICNVAEVVPLVGDISSQAESLEAVKLSAPPEPELVTLTEEGAGFEPLCVALKEMFEVETESMGLDEELALPYAESRQADQT
jgi:hypothetical protein